MNIILVNIFSTNTSTGKNSIFQNKVSVDNIANADCLTKLADIIVFFLVDVNIALGNFEYTSTLLIIVFFYTLPPLHYLLLTTLRNRAIIIINLNITCYVIFFSCSLYIPVYSVPFSVRLGLQLLLCKLYHCSQRRRLSLFSVEF
ncbi:hypothetical protein Hdeb2414_s0013g00402451 [Helianthus debilis subsp. tardiflorus]